MVWKFSAVFQVIHLLVHLPVAVIRAPLFPPLETCLHNNLWLCLWEKQVSCSREQKQNKCSRVKPSRQQPPADLPCQLRRLPQQGQHPWHTATLLAPSSSKGQRCCPQTQRQLLNPPTGHWAEGVQQHHASACDAPISFRPCPPAPRWVPWVERGQPAPVLHRAPRSLALCPQNSQKNRLHVLSRLLLPDGPPWFLHQEEVNALSRSQM